ncbi:MAG: GGDEF domain-containing protein [Lachnospiraceae bacterium]|nr:GGDEF domain-containing protein [Lachnospiraceae bacterium]
MGRVMQDVPEKVQKSVLCGTIAVNCILLLCHISFGILFYLYKAPILFYFNCFSIIIYVLCFELLRRRKTWAYVFIVFAEIYLFMMLSIVCLGWEYGFQHYCIGFVASLVFSDYFVVHSKKVRKRTIWLGAANVIIYIILRFWTYNNPPVYVLGNNIISNMFYVGNTVAGFAFLIMYIAIYSDTVMKLESELYDMANKDHLTGLCNRRQIIQVLKMLIETAAGEQFAIAMLDVDYFKNINDSYGHDAGDEVLKALANILNDEKAENEAFQPSRWGGEEFLVVCGYNGNKEDITELFETIRKRIADNTIIYGGNEIKVTVTIGLAIYEPDKSLDELVKEADAKLYKGKESGRNQVVSGMGEE